MTRPESTRPAATGADYGLLGLAIVAVSTSAPLIRYAAAPAMAIAMWRNLLALPVLAPSARSLTRAGPRERRLVVMAGLLLAAHFAAWIPSISYTSVASSVALVATLPVWTAVLSRLRGEHVEPAVWLGIGVAFVGVLVLTGVDLSISTRALFGDVLALLGGMLSAGYVMVGSEARRSVGTSAYAFGCYTVAAAVLLVVCVVAGLPITGYDGRTWLAIAGLVAGPQLLGHTLINRVLGSISPTAVSVSVLFEVVGATVLAALWFSETPPLAAIPAGVLIFSGIIIVIRSGRRRPEQGVPRG